MMGMATPFSSFAVAEAQTAHRGAPARASVNHTIALELPLTIEDGVLLSAEATLTNVQTLSKYTLSGFTLSGYKYVATVNVPEGVYSIEVTGKIKYTVDGVEKTADVKADMQNVTINSKTSSSTTIALNVYEANPGLVITELFYTGTKSPEGKQYNGDKYIKIGNNSDETQYLDGVAFMESEFLTVDKEDYKPDIMDQAMAVDAVYVFPGSGKDYPLEPGKEIIIAENARDHKALNPNSFDLSHADFELYDVSSNPAYSDTDNPDVPNMIGLYNYSLTYFTMHNRGFKAYALAVPQVSNDEYVADYKYDYSYDFNWEGNVYPKERHAYKMPNSWIIDAVNCSVPSMYVWNVTSATLDAGYTYCGTVNFDESRYGKSVIRRKLNGKWIDTNNSTNDFDAEVDASLLDPGQTGIESQAAEGMSVNSIKGGIRMELDRAAAVSVYNVSGQKVLSSQFSQGTHTLSLNAGMYIVKAGNNTYKVLVR